MGGVVRGSLAEGKSESGKGGLDKRLLFQFKIPW